MFSYDQDHPGLLTDLYELTMAAAYFQTGKYKEKASFELMIRHLAPSRSFLLATGLEQCVQFLERFRYSDEDIQFLRIHPMFESVKPAFFDFLSELRFTGTLTAVPEGTVVFAEEPLLRITAPIIEAQLVETYLLTMLTYQTNVATKAARVVQAAKGRGVMEFGSRRAHGPGAGLLAARASYVAGCVGTSNVLAGFEYGMPTLGTAAHSWTMSFDDEEESFRQFAKIYGEKAVLLIDTYDSIEGAKKALALGMPFKGVRLDSGDLLELSREIRKILDDGGRSDAIIVASGDLNEYSIEALTDAGAPIDQFGVGTELVTSRDAPALGGVYKLVETERDGEPHYAAKFSKSKISYPGKKQVFRFTGADGKYHHDVLALASENFSDGEPLLQPVLSDGKRVGDSPTLDLIRERAKRSLGCLPSTVHGLVGGAPYKVEKSAGLLELLETVRRQQTSVSAEA
jgi:nicotinate phosphoribosyltransferase